jgi:bifunctional enzyme CysN/CysC
VTESSPNVVWHVGDVSADDRQLITGGAGAVVWLTGLSGSGKSSVAVAVERRLVADRRAAYLLDGDNIRHGLNGDLGFSELDRKENIRRVAEVAILFADGGFIAVVPLISPYREARAAARRRAEAAGVRFVEVFVDTPLELCEERDPKGLYARARAGEIKGMTGIDDPYEAPDSPDLRLGPENGTPAEQADLVIGLLADT